MKISESGVDAKAPSWTITLVKSCIRRVKGVASLWLHHPSPRLAQHHTEDLKSLQTGKESPRWGSSFPRITGCFQEAYLGIASWDSLVSQLETEKGRDPSNRCTDLGRLHSCWPWCRSRGHNQRLSSSAEASWWPHVTCKLWNTFYSPLGQKQVSGPSPLLGKLWRWASYFKCTDTNERKWNYYQEEISAPHVPRSNIHNSQDMEIRCPFMNEWIKRNVHMRMECCSLIKRRHPVICDSMMNSEYHAEWYKSGSERQVLNDLIFVCNLKKLNSQKWRIDWWLPEAGESSEMLVQRHIFAIIKRNTFVEIQCTA